MIEYYLVESYEQSFHWLGEHSDGVAAERPRDTDKPIYLHVIQYDAAVHGGPALLPASPRGRTSSSTPRRAPPGVGDWWFVIGKSSDAQWPDLGLRSTGRPLSAQDMRALDALDESEAAVRLGGSLPSDPAAGGALRESTVPSQGSLMNELRAIVEEGYRRFPDIETAGAPGRPTTAYGHEVASLNVAARWAGAYAQQATIRPKFFGGNPDELQRAYILMVSLNHRYDKATLTTREEYRRLNGAIDKHMQACVEYFHADRGFFHAPFFRPRAKVLRGYVGPNGLASGETSADDRTLLQRLSLYVEAFPTWSTNCRAPRGDVAGPLVDLNRRTFDAVLACAPPAAILLAGKQNAEAMRRWVKPSNWVTWNMRPSGRFPCLVGLANFPRATGSIRVVRCNFLARVHGPNSDEELTHLGEFIANGIPKSHWVTV